MKRIAIDTHIVDRISDDPRLFEEIKMLGHSKLVIVLSHIIRDELEATPDSCRREKLLRVLDSLPKENVATHGFVLGISRLGEARLGNGKETGISLDQVKTKGRGALMDALVATTASGEADVLVTDDDELAKRMRSSAARCEIWSFQDFVRFIRGA